VTRKNRWPAGGDRSDMVILYLERRTRKASVRRRVA
jgi:hypothetical protein